MVEPVDPESRFCLICGRILEQVRLNGTINYRHARVDLPEDHPPVATRPSEAPDQVKYRCDFCLEEPVTHTLVLDKDIEAPSFNMAWDSEWAMCAGCTPFVLANDWLGLRRRVFPIQDARHGPLSENIKRELRVIYAEIQRHQVYVYAERA